MYFKQVRIEILLFVTINSGSKSCLCLQYISLKNVDCWTKIHWKYEYLRSSCKFISKDLIRLSKFVSYRFQYDYVDSIHWSCCLWDSGLFLLQQQQISLLRKIHVLFDIVGILHISIHSADVIQTYELQECSVSSFVLNNCSLIIDVNLYHLFSGYHRLL